MNTDKTIVVGTPGELADAVRSAPRVLAVGEGTKARLSAVGSEVVRISTVGMKGIIEYEPSEFTFTALAGTPVKEIVAALAERGQYLPFDPLWVEEGATIGGTVAAGLGGPGRFRFGGVRDFILGVRFVDGGGRLLRMGGKVVKNAAGFDLPKFFVGSLGRFGALAEVTFKVFPRAAAVRTLVLPVADAAAMTAIFTEAAGKRWELDALEGVVAGLKGGAKEDGLVLMRLAGPEVAMDAMQAEILATWPGTVMTAEQAEGTWKGVRKFGWAEPGATLMKVALVPGAVEEFLAQVRALGAQAWVGLGGNVGWVALKKGTVATEGMWRWPAMTLRGEGVLWPGRRESFEVFRAMKVALDPTGRFPSLDE